MNASGRIVIPGDPYGKRAPQVGKRGKNVILFPHKADKAYANRINEALALPTWVPITENRAPIWIEITAKLWRPPTHLLADGSLSAEGRRWVAPTKKPDFDNISKIVCDTFTHAGVWPDDAQVTRGVIEKVWADPRFENGACVIVEWGIRPPCPMP